MVRNCLSWVGAACIGGLIVAALGGAGRADKPGIVEASKVVLKAPDGSVRAILSGGADDRKGSQIFLGPDIKPRLTLGLSGRRASRPSA